MLKFLKVLISALTFLSLFATFHEYDSYKRQASSEQFLYEEGRLKPQTVAEMHEDSQYTYSWAKDILGQLLGLNLLIVALVILHQVLARKNQTDAASHRWPNPPHLPLFP